VQEDKRWTASEAVSLKQQAEALLLNLYQILISLNSSTYLQEKINVLKNSYVIHRCT
jgi:6-phosphogluconate dehydrogenase (decarboxylating)